MMTMKRYARIEKIYDLLDEIMDTTRKWKPLKSEAFFLSTLSRA